MKQQIIRYGFEPKNYMKTGSLDYSETFRHPTPEQVADALKIGLKFKLWMILHPDYFGPYLPSFESQLIVSNEWYSHNPPKANWHLISRMCPMCPCTDMKSIYTNDSSEILLDVNMDGTIDDCPKITPVFFGKGVVKMVEAETDVIAKGFPCLEWVRHV